MAMEVMEPAEVQGGCRCTTPCELRRHETKPPRYRRSKCRAWSLTVVSDLATSAEGERVVNVSSIGGKVGVPHLAAYCASKFALTGLSQSVRAELARENVQITTVCPGLMRTGSIFNAWFEGRHLEEFAWFAIAGSLPLVSIDAQRAAAKIVDAAKHGDAEVVITWSAKLAAAAAGLAPAITADAAEFANRLLPARLLTLKRRNSADGRAGN